MPAEQPAVVVPEVPAVPDAGQPDVDAPSTVATPGQVPPGENSDQPPITPNAITPPSVNAGTPVPDETLEPTPTRKPLAGGDQSQPAPTATASLSQPTDTPTPGPSQASPTPTPPSSGPTTAPSTATPTVAPPDATFDPPAAHGLEHAEPAALGTDAPADQDARAAAHAAADADDRSVRQRQQPSRVQDAAAHADTASNHYAVPDLHAQANHHAAPAAGADCAASLMPEGTYILDSRALLEIGGFIGVLAGACTFLMRMALKSKDDHLAEVTKERDFYRDIVQDRLGVLLGKRREGEHDG